MNILKIIFWVSCVSALLLIIENMAFGQGYGLLYIHKNASVVSIIFFSVLSWIWIGIGAPAFLKRDNFDDEY